ncbi:MAG: helix-turn-helix domain-containing protein [Oscillatoriaceae bacterium SKW80]|nr:helix-turn-helix domain-containing protein [Oscillatoriaceae bacterium SKYG93]MCX8119269.1 helix-turn-helix domain-containing protein [Oscillatoriaceae bacterium SKW80]MDW8454736.1 transposase [Oscillatoriaceae cyanobacterium SKYGB_i_bin93]HIK28484.1 helix-turn-helix domain-containing protein [Oscillatoriaceae cyanobacterium M7585_C2015_266]
MESRYRYRFYPTNQQKLLLAKLYGCARWVWNEALAYCQEVGKYIGYNALTKRLTVPKKQVEWLTEVSSVALQQALRNLDRACSNFFKGKGAPQFKKKSNRQSVTLTKSSFSLQGKKVYLAKIGEMSPIWIKELPSQPIVVEVPRVVVSAKFPSIGID